MMRLVSEPGKSMLSNIFSALPAMNFALVMLFALALEDA